MESITTSEVREGQRVRVHYRIGAAREGIVKRHNYYNMVFEQENGSIGSLFDPAPEFSPANGWDPYIEKVELIYQPQHPHNRTDLDHQPDRSTTMTYHENPADIPVGTNVALTYETGNTYTGTVTSPGVMTDTSGRGRSLTIDGDRVTVLESTVDSIGAIKALESRLEFEKDQRERMEERYKRANSALTALSESVTKMIEGIVESGDLDDDSRDDLYRQVGLEPPKPDPIDVQLTITVSARMTPTSRDVLKAANRVNGDEYLAGLVTGLDMIDFDSDAFDVDVYHGINVQVDDFLID